MAPNPLPDPDPRDTVLRCQAFVEATGLALLELDTLGGLLWWNPAAGRLFDHGVETLRGPAWVDELVEGEDRSRAWSLMERAGATGVPVRAELRLRLPRGVVLETEWEVVPLVDEDGKLLGFGVAVQDRTADKRSEASLRQAQKLESLGLLAGGIAHDFNNLLTAVLGHVDLALGKAAEGEVAQHLRQVEATARRAADLSRQMLMFTGRSPLMAQPVDLRASVMGMAELLRASVPKKVRLELDMESRLPQIHADPLQMQQVLLNLVVNAGEAIGERGGKVVVRVRSEGWAREALAEHFPGQVLHPGPYLRMEVEDDGEGMDAETIGKIFDPFFSTRFTGRGLGLSAMLGIVRGHRAGLRVRSVKGEGTTFTMLFPVPSSGAKEEPEEARFSGDVLVVDDEEVVRDLAGLALEALGFRIHLARDGAEALDRVRELGPGLRFVLLDLTMPRMGGDEVLCHLRDMAPDLKVILTSGYGEKDSLRDLRGLRPNAFLQKPFRVPELQRLVRRMVG